MNIDEIIEQYTIESSIDTNIDRLNVTDVQEKLVNNKHKWSARLINHKIKINKYRNLRVVLLEERVDEYQNTQPVMVNRSIAEKAVSRKKDIRDIDDKINNELLIIQHVENIYKNISFATNDIKNLVELMKLEMQ
jgi:hypothetical protein